MFYYKLKSDNTIEQYTEIADGETVPSFIAEDFTATDRKIVRIHDGSLQFSDEVDWDAENKAVAEQEEAARIAALQPTIEDRVTATEEALIAALDDMQTQNDALAEENTTLNDTVLALAEIIDSMAAAE